MTTSPLVVEEEEEVEEDKGTGIPGTQSVVTFVPNLTIVG